MRGSNLLHLGGLSLPDSVVDVEVAMAIAAMQASSGGRGGDANPTAELSEPGALADLVEQQLSSGGSSRISAGSLSSGSVSGGGGGGSSAGGASATPLWPRPSTRKASEDGGGIGGGDEDPFLAFPVDGSSIQRRRWLMDSGGLLPAGGSEGTRAPGQSSSILPQVTGVLGSARRVSGESNARSHLPTPLAAASAYYGGGTRGYAASGSGSNDSTPAQGSGGARMAGAAAAPEPFSASMDPSGETPSSVSSASTNKASNAGISALINSAQVPPSGTGKLISRYVQVSFYLLYGRFFGDWFHYL